MVYRCFPKLSELGFNFEEGAICLLEVAARCQSPLVVLAKFGVHDRIRQLEVGLCLLVALQHVHAAAQVIVHCGSVDSVATEAQLANFTRLQEAAQRPGRLIDMVEH